MSAILVAKAIATSLFTVAFDVTALYKTSMTLVYDVELFFFQPLGLNNKIQDCELHKLDTLMLEPCFPSNSRLFTGQGFSIR